jgi:hypothetical protein
MSPQHSPLSAGNHDPGDPKMADQEASNQPIVDQNVERLLTEAYRPQSPDPQFTQRVLTALQAEALRLAQPRPAEAAPSAAAAAGPPAARAAPPSAPAAGKVVFGWAVAAALLCGFVWLARPGTRPSGRGGQNVSLGRPAHAAVGNDQALAVPPLPEAAAAAAGNSPRFATGTALGFVPGPHSAAEPYAFGFALAEPGERNGLGTVHLSYSYQAGPKELLSNAVAAPGLVPRAIDDHDGSLPQQAAPVGSRLLTGPAERRRVRLADGSVAYLNSNTQAVLQAEREIRLLQGELYLVVAPRDQPQAPDAASQPAAAPPPDPAPASHFARSPDPKLALPASQPVAAGDERPWSKFVVKTPQREVAALGTRFAVSTAGDQTSVRVVQGKVQVSSLPDGQTFVSLAAGQELPPAGDSPRPAPRAAHQLDWARDLIARSEASLVPESQHSGGSLVAADPRRQEIRLSLRKYHVDVHIEDGFARTTIDQTYFNHEWSRLEGTFHFPLPGDASISRLAMYVSGKLMEGGMCERDHARQVFETIKSRALDPALLEWVDGSTFKMRVFPLEPRQEKRIILSYTQRLPSAYGKSQYRFPAGHNLGEVHDWSACLKLADAPPRGRPGNVSRTICAPRRGPTMNPWCWSPKGTRCAWTTTWCLTSTSGGA